MYGPGFPNPALRAGGFCHPEPLVGAVRLRMRHAPVERFDSASRPDAIGGGGDAVMAPPLLP